MPPDVIEQVTTEAKYDGYIGRQTRPDRAVPAGWRNSESRPTSTIDAIPQLRAEAREKFERVRPVSLGQAGRISGISPADIATLLIHLKRREPTWPRRVAAVSQPVNQRRRTLTLTRCVAPTLAPSRSSTIEKTGVFEFIGSSHSSDTLSVPLHMPSRVATPPTSSSFSLVGLAETHHLKTHS